MILNVLRDLKSLCGLSPPFLFPNNLRPTTYKQNETEGGYTANKIVRRQRATNVAA